MTLFLSLLSLATSPAVLWAGDGWAAFNRGTHCEAMARSVLVATRASEQQPRITLAFDRSGPRRGQVEIRARRPVRPGSSIILTISNQPFLLAARGTSGWSRGPIQEKAVIAALRAGTPFTVEARDAAGRRMVDRYDARGAPTAIDAAAAACARAR